MNYKHYFILLLLVVFIVLLLNKSNFYINMLPKMERFISNPISVEKLHPRPYDSIDKPIDNCKKRIRSPCRPPMTVQVYVHYIIGWSPTIKGKKLDHYLRSLDYKKSIHKNINEIWKDTNINFDLIDIYFEKARTNLSYYYPNDIDRSLELESINTVLEKAHAFKDRHLIRDSLINLTDPFNREKKALHIYIFPYLGKKTICRTVYGEDFPIIFAAQYNNKYTDKICRSCIVTPYLGKNMEMSKEISKHIGYVFGLLESYDNSSLMSDSKFGTKLSNYEIDLVRHNVQHEIYDLNRNFTEDINNLNYDVSESKKYLTKTMNKADCYLLKNPNNRFRCLQHKYNNRKFWYRADPDSIPSENDQIDLSNDSNGCKLEDKIYYMETLDKPFM